MPSVVDHLVVAGPTLAAASAAIESALGVSPLGGGQHARMGTHNQVVATGNDTYLEAIAIDPSGVAPDRPRWFGLDEFSGPAALHHWVVRTSDVAALSPSEDLGEVTPMQRGELTWRIGIPADGRLRADGVAPSIISWDVAPPQLPDSSVRFVSLTLLHPDVARVRALLESLDLVGPVTGQADLGPGLIAAFETPDGPGFLTSDGLGEPSLDRERQVAMDLFHATWRLLDLTERDTDQAAAMVQCALASLWHWRRVGAPTQWAIGEWQCSRVYAVLGDGAAALAHAQRALAICEAGRVDEFVPASAHEALARAYAVLGDMDAAREQRNLSYRIAVDLDDEDRDVIEHDLGTLPID
ncbi:MAG: VOC family protein [Candidatus Nanopelagicales bacterium]